LGNGSRILIVDDQEGIRKLLTEACSFLGFNVEVASTGREALEIAKKHNFEIALVDLKMAEMNGIDTMKRLMKTVNGLKGIVMTGYGDSDLLDEAQNVKIDAVIRKPFNLQEIKEVLEKVINN